MCAALLIFALLLFGEFRVASGAFRLFAGLWVVLTAIEVFGAWRHSHRNEAHE